jgi:hypothetical protein
VTQSLVIKEKEIVQFDRDHFSVRFSQDLTIKIIVEWLYDDGDLIIMLDHCGEFYSHLAPRFDPIVIMKRPIHVCISEVNDNRRTYKSTFSSKYVKIKCI